MAASDSTFGAELPRHCTKLLPKVKGIFCTVPA
jgi:hypothetical protein